MKNNKKAIIVKDVEKVFKIPLDNSFGIKQKIVNFANNKKGYRLFKPLKKISLTINHGDFYGIVGRNGSGKSTLLKTIAGIYNPDSGSVEVNGSLVPFIELGVGFNGELSGRENVYLNCALLGFNRIETKSMYEDIVEFAELHDFMEEKIKNYSSGMQVRLAFSIAIQAKGDILLLDEVLAVGDTSFQEKCFKYFEELKRNKKTIILVTHDMSAIKRFCNKAVYIENGQILKEGTPLDVANYYLEANIVDISKNDIKKVDIKKNNCSISARIIDNNEDISNKIIEFDYFLNNNIKAYVGCSIIRDGISVAEITTSLNKLLIDKGKLKYKLDTSYFNCGVYQFTASLFNSENRELIAVSKVRNIFTVNGYDITKGGALKLKDAWDYE